MDRARLPVVFRLSESFWEDARNGTTDEKLQFVLCHLALMTADSFWCRITTLELCRCEMNGQVVERLAGVLAQCPALAHLELSDNFSGAGGAERLAAVLAQCAALAHLNLSGNRIGAGGAKSFAGVLAQCTALAHLDLR